VGPYAAAIAAESLHWLNWEVVLPAVARALVPSGLLVIVTARVLLDLPWQSDLTALISRYSTNREYVAYDIAHELESRGLFHEIGREPVQASGFVQDLDDYIESFHSRNGLGRAAMGDAATAFDRELRELVHSSGAGARVEAAVATTLVWGKPVIPKG
jgi:hypothetical protein